MQSLNFDDKMAQDCSLIASSNISAIHDIYHSRMYCPLDRFSICEWLTSSILPLICILVKPSGDLACQNRAMEAYQDAISLLQDMAPRFSPARHALSRMRKLTRAADRAVGRLQFPDGPNSNSTDPDLDTLILELSGVFDAPDPQYEWQIGFLDGGLDAPFSFTLDSPGPTGPSLRA